MDYEKILLFSFSWLKDRAAWKYIVLLWVITAIEWLLIIGIGWLLFGDLISSLISNPASLAQLLTNPIVLLSNLFLFIAFAALIGIVFALVSYYVNALVTIYGLKKAGIEPAKFSLVKYLKLVLLVIVQFFAAIFSALDLKLLLVLAAAVVILIIALFAGWILAILAFLLLLVYGIIVIYNSLRLSMSPVIYLHKDIGIIDAIKSSWKMTDGKVLSILLAMIVVGIVSAIVLGIIQVVLQMIILLPLSAITGISAPSVAGASSISVLGSEQIAGLLMYYALVYVSTFISSFIISAFSVLIFSLMTVGIYREIMGSGFAPPEESWKPVQKQQETKASQQPQQIAPKPMARPMAPEPAAKQQESKLALSDDGTAKLNLLFTLKTELGSDKEIKITSMQKTDSGWKAMVLINKMTFAFKLKPDGKIESYEELGG
ncbi:MAG: hypothetical protein V1494_04680 [Candidatus Diapherotrites archaeon]